MEGKCCICGEEVKSIYSSIKRLDDGTVRVYSGHKSCLSHLNTKLINGEELEYEEIDVSKYKS